ncbi:MAG: hypothetical protein JST11_06415 [Acidobacteria bacterium]|nr:hypothetical protein [Acidobacteriota bacterium]
MSQGIGRRYFFFGTHLAVADVDFARGTPAFAKWPKAEKYKDFREMLDKHQMEFTNNREATRWIKPTYRKGWEVKL